MPTLKYFFAHNVSFNIYLFHGGTNFGFTSGAGANGTTFEKSNYQPEITSYDFTSPLDEAGDPTEKYYVVKHLLKEAVGSIFMNIYINIYINIKNDFFDNKTNQNS